MYQLDAYLVDKWDALLGKLQERGLRLPALMRELATGRIIAFLICIGLSLSRPDQSWWLIGLFTVFVLILLPVYWGAYSTYAKDAQRDWTPSLAKVYRDKAFAQREKFRSTRVFDWLFFTLFFGMDISDWALLHKAPELVDITFWFWWIFILLLSYTRCVFPREPDLRQRSPNLAFNPT